VLLLAAVCGLTGCLSRPSLNKQTFNFSGPAISTTNAASTGRVLGIRKLQIASPFDGRSLVYRTGEFTYARDPYAEFLDSPSEELVAPMRAWFREDNSFSTVLEASSALKPNTLVEISVSQLFGDFRRPEKPAAILTLRFVFFDAPNGMPGKVMLQREYSRGIPLKSATAAALMEGWNQALAEIFAEVAEDLRKSNAG
jgi:cholesterol transport system auxiliary component